MVDQTSSAKHDINALNTLYTDGESCDQEVFAEQRSNLLLVAGEHYNRRQSLFYKRLRDTRELNQEQRLRLTKNHIQNICKQYANNIISATPGVGFEPKDEKSVQDQKAADLHHAVWQDFCEKYGIESNLIDQWCDDFIQVGEVIVKIFWDPFAGEVKAFEQKIDESGAPLFIDRETGEETTEALDSMGQAHELVADENLPVFAGAFVFEEVYGFNCLRSAQAKRMEESPHLIIRKMAQRSDMLTRYAKDPDKSKFFVASGEDTFVIFDGGKGGYKKTEGLCMIREYYFRPSPEYPRGYFFFTTKEGIFEEGELPGGIFPIVSQSYENIQTTCRGRSPIKHMRPYQIEINRAASKIAEHQVTLGDDKLLVQNGTKVSAGVGLPGIRAINYTGAEPEVLPGRAGDQYVAYMEGQIQELYQVMNIAMDGQEKQTQMDPFALLFRSASQKKVFQRYTKRFENFLMNICKTSLRLAKVHLPDDQIIWAVGKSEQINISEFKSANDICYQIIVEAQSDDIETKLGKQLVLNHVLQYVGPQMKPEDIGKLMRQMPYANFDGSFDDMTMNYDTTENVLLALDRGEPVQPNQYDDHVYSIKRLILRSRKPDFRFLPPQVQQAYAMLIQQHEQLESQRQMQVQQAEQGYIPTGGQLLGCDFFVTDPENPSKTRRARLPSEAIQWLVTHLEAQGQSLESLEGLNPGGQGQIAQMMIQQRGGMPQPQLGGPHTAVMPPPGMGLRHPVQSLPPGGNGNSPFRGP
jgi:hypothetical protein